MTEQIFTDPPTLVEILSSKADIVILKDEAKLSFVKSLAGLFDPNPQFESQILNRAAKASEIRAVREDNGSGGNLGNFAGRSWSFE